MSTAHTHLIGRYNTYLVIMSLRCSYSFNCSQNHSYPSITVYSTAYNNRDPVHRHWRSQIQPIPCRLWCHRTVYGQELCGMQPPHHFELLCPNPVYNVDGIPNEAGSITEIEDVILQFNGHSECTSFTVTGMGKQV